MVDEFHSPFSNKERNAPACIVPKSLLCNGESAFSSMASKRIKADAPFTIRMLLRLDDSSEDCVRRALSTTFVVLLSHYLSFPETVVQMFRALTDCSSTLWMQMLVLFVIPDNAVITNQLKVNDADRAEQLDEFLTRLPSLKEDVLAKAEKGEPYSAAEFVDQCVEQYLLS